MFGPESPSWPNNRAKLHSTDEIEKPLATGGPRGAAILDKSGGAVRPRTMVRRGGADGSAGIWHDWGRFADAVVISARGQAPGRN